MLAIPFKKIGSAGRHERRSHAKYRYARHFQLLPPPNAVALLLTREKSREPLQGLRPEDHGMTA